MDQAALNGLRREGTELVWQAQDVALGNVSLLAVVHKEHPPASFRLLHQLPAVPATTEPQHSHQNFETGTTTE